MRTLLPATADINRGNRLSPTESGKIVTVLNQTSDDGLIAKNMQVSRPAGNNGEQGPQKTPGMIRNKHTKHAEQRLGKSGKIVTVLNQTSDDGLISKNMQKTQLQSKNFKKIRQGT